MKDLGHKVTGVTAMCLITNLSRKTKLLFQWKEKKKKKHSLKREGKKMMQTAIDPYDYIYEGLEQI